MLVGSSLWAGEGYDFGDAPDASIDPSFSYPTVLADDGARHWVPENPTHYLTGDPGYVIQRASADGNGIPGNDYSWSPSVSGDGRFVAFYSKASNLVPGDTNQVSDVFVKDLETGEITRVSVDSSGAQGNKGSAHPSISQDGRWVAFQSLANNLVLGDTNNLEDVFLHDRQTGSTVLVSVDPMGNAVSVGASASASISSDGKRVAFASRSGGLVAGDSNGTWDVFVRDMDAGVTERASVSSAGVPGEGASFSPEISGDGNSVAFTSAANLLVPGTNQHTHVFVRDLMAGTTSLVSVSSDEIQGNSSSISPGISDDGQLVVFRSGAKNLIVGDSNRKVDVFLRDLAAGETIRLGVAPGGVQGGSISFDPAISGDGTVAAFAYRDDLVVHRLDTGEIARGLLYPASPSLSLRFPSISDDGTWITFESRAKNLVPGEPDNTHADVFAHRYQYLIDYEADGVPSGFAEGDGFDGDDDEKGVRFGCCFWPGSTVAMETQASAPGFVNAWVDFDGDGQWTPSEQIATDAPVSAGTDTILFAVPAGDPIPRTFARIRFTSYDSLGALQPTGLAADGEVEDQLVSGTPLFADGFESGDMTAW